VLDASLVAILHCVKLRRPGRTFRVVSADTRTLMNAINVAPGGTSLAALIPATGEIAHVDRTTRRVVSRARVAAAPTGLTFGTDGGVVYVSDQRGP